MKFFQFIGFIIFYFCFYFSFRTQNKATIVRTEQAGIFDLPSPSSTIHGNQRVLNYTSAEHAYAIPTEEILKIKQQIKEAKKTWYITYCYQAIYWKTEHWCKF